MTATGAEPAAVTLAWTDDAERLVLTIARARLEAHLAGPTGRPPAREQLEAFVVTRLLLGDGPAGRDVALPAARPSRLRPVLDHMEAHPDRRLTPGDLARVGCMSVRALHAAFRDELGVPPMAHLRRIRLDRVHADLLRGAAGSGGGAQRIGDVAVRWGFFHPSRFARQYQERFGELPSETARRG